MLPRICSSSEVYAEAQGQLAGVPLAGILGDQQAALVGQVASRRPTKNTTAPVAFCS